MGKTNVNQIIGTLRNRSKELWEHEEFLLVVLDSQQTNLLSEAWQVLVQPGGRWTAKPVDQGIYHPVQPMKATAEEVVSEENRGIEDRLDYARTLALRQVLGDPDQLKLVRRFLVRKDGPVALEPEEIPQEKGVVCRLCIYLGESRPELKLGAEKAYFLEKGMCFLLDEKLLLRLPGYPEEAIQEIYLPQEEGNGSLTPILHSPGSEEPKEETLEDEDLEDEDLEDEDLEDEDLEDEDLSTVDSSKLQPGVELTGFLRYHYKRRGNDECPDIRLLPDRVVIDGEEKLQKLDGVLALRRNDALIQALVPQKVREEMLTRLGHDSAFLQSNSLDSTYIHPIVYFNQGPKIIKVDGHPLRSHKYFLSYAFTQPDQQDIPEYRERLDRVAYALQCSLFTAAFLDRVSKKMTLERLQEED